MKDPLKGNCPLIHLPSVVSKHHPFHPCFLLVSLALYWPASVSSDSQYQLVTSPRLGIFLLSLDSHKALVSVEYPQMGERHPFV